MKGDPSRKADVSGSGRARGTRFIFVAGSGAILALFTRHALNGLACLSGWYARLLLDGGYDATTMIGET